MNILVEACVDSVEGALAAERAGAGRLELCASLVEGGTTPSAGMMRALAMRARVPVFAMVRPRGGDFVYNAGEIEVMLRDVEAAKTFGVHGIVSGALHASAAIDEEGTAVLLEAAHPLPFTFHRAIDQTRDPAEALDTLLALGVERVLTSGGAATAADGAAVIRRLVALAGTRIVVMAGGGVRHATAAAVVEATGVREVHVGARRRVTSAMQQRPGGARIGALVALDDYDWAACDDAEIAAVVRAVAAPPPP